MLLVSILLTTLPSTVAMSLTSINVTYAFIHKSRPIWPHATEKYSASKNYLPKHVVLPSIQVLIMCFSDFWDNSNCLQMTFTWLRNVEQFLESKTWSPVRADTAANCPHQFSRQYMQYCWQTDNQSIEVSDMTFKNHSRLSKIIYR